MNLLPDEFDLVGNWKLVADTVERDSTSIRIDRLTKECLHKLATDASGWDLLYEDPEDGRLWELTYPNSDVEGGGPPRLTCITKESAREKYGLTT
ncbi:Imm27 family immunity protein [Dokdonella sp.]|uniref:Imm27 family immunity protein n=1 Tax=Dokdonella sp. TaxID=2291710 RepID=UPI003BAE7FAE